MPTRGLIGLRNSILTATRGTGILNTIFAEYGEWAGECHTFGHTFVTLPLPALTLGVTLL